MSVEEPLEIRLAYGPADARLEQSISITMRTPGNDLELTQGFLFGEGIVHATSDVLGVEHCGPPSPDKGIHNVVRIELSETAQFDPDALLRHTFTSSSCGVCGKTSLDAVKAIVPDYKSKGFAVNGRQLMPQHPLIRPARSNVSEKTWGATMHSINSSVRTSIPGLIRCANVGYCCQGEPVSNWCKKPQSPAFPSSHQSDRHRA